MLRGAFSSHEIPRFDAQAQSQGFGAGNIAVSTALQLQKSLSALPPEKLNRIFALTEELREEEGVYISPKEIAPQEPRSDGGFDLMPLIISGEEWARIEAGLNQRVRAWNLFLRDIYSGQEILRSGVVPYEIVYADPNFHRGCARLPGVTASYLQLTAFDLQQNTRGQWIVIEEHLGVADGASYALKKRQILRQVAPRLFDGLEILPIEDFAAQVLDVLQDLVRNPEGTARACSSPKAAATSTTSTTPRSRARWACPSCRATTSSCSTAGFTSRPSAASSRSTSSCGA